MFLIHLQLTLNLLHWTSAEEALLSVPHPSTISPKLHPPGLTDDWFVNSFVMSSQASVSHSVHMGWISLVLCPFRRWLCPGMDTHPQPPTPSGGQHMYSWQAGSTHPTGMFSCCYCSGFLVYNMLVLYYQWQHVNQIH